jgi:hypothetical protein
MVIDVLFGWLFLKEKVSLVCWSGIGLVFSGIALLSVLGCFFDRMNSYKFGRRGRERWKNAAAKDSATDAKKCILWPFCTVECIELILNLGLFECSETLNKTMSGCD